LPLLQGTLDLIILGTIRPKPIHGYGIATAVDERWGGQLQVEDAALYQALHRWSGSDTSPSAARHTGSVAHGTYVAYEETKSCAR